MPHTPDRHDVQPERDWHVKVTYAVGSEYTWVARGSDRTQALATVANELQARGLAPLGVGEKPPPTGPVVKLEWDQQP